MIIVSTTTPQEAHAMTLLMSTAAPPSLRWKVYLLGQEFTRADAHPRLPDLGLPHPANRPEGNGR